MRTETATYSRCFYFNDMVTKYWKCHTFSYQIRSNECVIRILVLDRRS